MNKKAVKRGLMPYLLLFLVMAGVLYFFNVINQKVNKLTYDKFMEEAVKGNLTEVQVIPRSRASVYEIRGKLKDYNENETFVLKVPMAEEPMTRLLELEEEQGFKLETINDPDSSTFLLFILNVLPMVILIGGAFFIITKQMGGANKSMDFGKSRARLSENNKKVTFKEVAGLDEEKEPKFRCKNSKRSIISRSSRNR